MRKSILKDKSYEFAIEVVNICRTLQREQREYIVSKQLLRSGTAIGALVREAEFAQSRADFAHKMNIALKEANETDYWLLLLHDTNYMQPNDNFVKIQSVCKELIAMLASTVKTIRDNP